MQPMHIVYIYRILFAQISIWTTGADLGFIKGGGATSRSNLLGRGVQSTLPSMRSVLELGGSGGMPSQENFEK